MANHPMKLILTMGIKMVNINEPCLDAPRIRPRMAPHRRWLRPPRPRPRRLIHRARPYGQAQAHL